VDRQPADNGAEANVLRENMQKQAFFGDGPEFAKSSSELVDYSDSEGF